MLNDDGWGGVSNLLDLIFMDTYNLKIEVLRRYYSKLGLSQDSALYCARTDADLLQAGKRISEKALSVLPIEVNPFAISDAFGEDLDQRVNEKIQKAIKLERYATAIVHTPSSNKTQSLSLIEGESLYIHNPQKISKRENRSFTFDPSEVYK